MISTDTSEGLGLPVVHIRIVCDSGCHQHACDFCQKSFHSAAECDQHMNFSHSSLNIQEVYVCPCCKCCLLNHSDLQDHLSARHQIQVEKWEESTLCEFCGLNLTSKECLEDHTVLRHYPGMTEALTRDIEIVELSLKDISNMGMGDPDCKTLFQVIEISIAKDLTKSSQSKKDGDKEKDMNNWDFGNAYEGIIPLSHENQSEQYTRNNSVISPLKRTSGNENFVNNYNSFNEIVSQEDMQEECTSHLEIIVCSDLDEKSVVASSPGEIILSVESEEELVWNKDVMSQVISSSGILQRTQGNFNVQKGDPDSHSSSTMKQMKKNSNRNDSFRMSHTNQREEQKCSIKPHDPPVINEEEALIICDQEINVAKTDVIKTTVTGYDPHQNLLSPMTEKTQTTDNQEKLLRGKVCSLCGIVFRQLGDLQQHSHTFHGIRIKCDLCDDTFVFSKSLRNHHLRKHSSSAHFQCKDCDKLFKCRSNLWSHRLTHLSQEMHRFLCPQCPQRFTTKSKLNVHLQSHSGKKKFQCEECGRGFVYQGLLLRHMKKHISETNIRLIKKR